jgi:tRNA pseudouridine32 synthase/23S rRNA pseudouridine746 synthase
MPDFDGTRLPERVLFRDRDIIVLDKPSGIAVHKGPGGGANLESFFEALRFGLPRNPALAHRLDRETSGCLVLGRHRKALARLGRLFRDGRIAKTYWAVVVGAPPQAEGEIALPLARRSHDKRSWWMKVAEAGDKEAEAALSRYRVLGRGDGLTWLELSPQTGRTHQLRVHCAAIGCPIAGDGLYGGDRAGAAARRIQLHARAITIPGRGDNAALTITAPAPRGMATLLEACGFAGDASPLQPEQAAP